MVGIWLNIKTGSDIYVVVVMNHVVAKVIYSQYGVFSIKNKYLKKLTSFESSVVSKWFGDTVSP